MQIHHERISHYTLTGALSGAASTGLGALMLHPGNPDRFSTTKALQAGFVGGAATHVAIGLLAAFSPSQPLKAELYKLGASAVLGSVTSGVLGGALLGLTGQTTSSTGDLLLEGALGGLTLGVVGGVVALSLTLCGVALWCGKEVHDEAYRVLEHGEEHP